MCDYYCGNTIFMVVPPKSIDSSFEAFIETAIAGYSDWYFQSSHGMPFGLETGYNRFISSCGSKH